MSNRSSAGGRNPIETQPDSGVLGNDATRPPAATNSKRNETRAALIKLRRWLLQLGFGGTQARFILVPLILVWIALALASPYFLTQANITNILLNAAPLAFIAAGVTLTLIAAEIDLAVGSIVALTGSFVAVLMKNHGVPWPLAVAGGLALGVAIGVLSGWFVTRVGIPSFVATLAMLGIARGVALILTGGQAISGLPTGFGWLGTGRIASVPFPVLLAALVFVLLHLVATRTKFGLNIYAVGGNVEAARLAGVMVLRVKMGVLILSGFLSAIAGVILAARLNAGSGVVGEDLLLDSVAAVVIGGASLLGGVGTITGTAIGTLLIASIRNGLVLLSVTAFWQKVTIGLLILLAVSIDHFGKRRTS